MQDRYHQLVEVLLRRTAGPYISATNDRFAHSFDHLGGGGEKRGCDRDAQRLRRL